jgi:hypothetical protein
LAIFFSAVIGVGAWSLMQKPSGGIASRGESIVFIVVATAGLAVCLKGLHSRGPSQEELNRRNQTFRQTIFSGDIHEYRIVTADQYPAADHFFYRGNTERLERNGFKVLGDVENFTLSQLVPGTATFTRSLVSADGKIVAGIRHSTPTPFKRDRYTVELHSEFSDGTFLITNNTGKATLTRQMPGITAIFFPASTTIEQLLQLHKEVLDARLLAAPDLIATQVASVDDYIHFQRRLYDVQTRNEKARDFQRPSATQTAARYLLETNRAIFSDKPTEYRLALPSEFPNIDLSFYERVRADLERRGFKFLGDIENMTLTKVFPHMRTLIREMVSDDGMIMASAYHARLPQRDVKSVDFITELSDERYLVTGTSEERTLPVPGIEKLSCGYATPLEELLGIHKQRLDEALTSNPSIVATKVTILEESEELSRRLHNKRAMDRKARGFITAEDFQKIKGRALTAKEKLVFVEVEKLTREEVIAAADGDAASTESIDDQQLI